MAKIIRGKRGKMYSPEYCPDLEYIHSIFMKKELDKIEKLRKLKDPDIVKEWYFLTVNPDTSKVSLREFMKTIEKSLSKKWINYYIFVIEQRGETEEELGRGFHTHIIFNKGIKHCKVVKEMSNTFKNMCDVSNYHLFNIKNIGEQEKLRKIEYITGTKSDEQKHLKQKMDIIFRQKENLKSFYILEDASQIIQTSN